MVQIYFHLFTKTCPQEQYILLLPIDPLNSVIWTVLRNLLEFHPESTFQSAARKTSDFEAPKITSEDVRSSPKQRRASKRGNVIHQLA